MALSNCFIRIALFSVSARGRWYYFKNKHMHTFSSFSLSLFSCFYFFFFFTHLIFTLEWYFIFKVGMGEGPFFFFFKIWKEVKFFPSSFLCILHFESTNWIFIHFYRIFIIVIKLMRNPKFASPPKKNPPNLYFKELFSSLPFYLNIK